MPISVPTSLDEAVAYLADYPDATVVNGGTDVMVDVNFHRRRPTRLLALRRVGELREWHHDPAAATVTIGAGLPYREMEGGELARLVPALADAARTVGSPQIRAAGTLGGNLATCSPAGDALPVLSALDAAVSLTGATGSRELSVHDFMLGVKRTALAPDEIIRSVTVPVVDGWQGYAKVGVRNAMVIATASACLVRPNGGLSRLALGAVGPTVVRCRDTEAWLETSGGDGEDIATEFGRRAAAEARPIDDHRSSAAYRRHAVAVLAARLLTRALRA